MALRLSVGVDGPAASSAKFAVAEQRSRPWIRLSALVWTRPSMFSPCMALMRRTVRCCGAISSAALFLRCLPIYRRRRWRWRRAVRPITGGGRCRRWAHEVVLIPAQYVKPFVKRSKNDRNDAEAISEAAARPGMAQVLVKSAEQQAAAMLLSVRGLLSRQRTQLVNACAAMPPSSAWLPPRATRAWPTCWPPPSKACQHRLPTRSACSAARSTGSRRR